MLSLSALGQTAPGGGTQQLPAGDLIVDRASMPDSAHLDDGFVKRLGTPSGVRGGLVNRGSPPLGGGCQTQDINAALNYSGANVADNFNASANGTVSAISWSAVFLTNGVTANPPASESFRVRFFVDAGGLPGAQIGSNITISSPSRVNSGTTLFNGAPIWDYQANIAGPAVTAGTCYWVEIKNTSTFGTGAASFWLQAGPIPGDTVAYQALGANPCAYRNIDQVDGDMAFCLNVGFNTLDGLNCPILPVPAPPCTNSTANGGNGVTPIPDGTGFFSVTPGFTYTGTQRFQIADLFRSSAGGNLNQICFWGFFTAIGAGRADNCIREFDVTVFNVDPGTLLPTTALATRRVGTNGVTVATGLGALGEEQFSITLPPGQEIAVSAGTCYALSISHRIITADPDRQAIFLWGQTTTDALNTTQDNSILARSVSLAGVAGAWGTFSGLNVSYLLNVAPVIRPNCVPPPGNDLCSGATNLLLNGTAINGTNVAATADAVGGCGFNLVDTPAVWYTFVGTGNDVTVTTCNAGTPTTDTVVHVFCADTCAGPFNCVDSNDDADPACGTNAFASTVTVPTTLNQRYYVLVHHPIQNFVNGAFVNRNPGPFQISALQGGPSTTPPTCASLARCVLDNEPFDIEEGDVCGADATDTNGACDTAESYPVLGQIAKGVLSTDGNFRDFDMWTLPASANGQTVEISFTAENPVIIQVQNFSPDCNGTGTVVAGFGLLACTPFDAALFEANLPATGVNVVLILPPSFDGQPCDGPIAFNDYRLRVSIPVQGACCIEATACFVTTLGDCADQSVSVNDHFTPNITCDPQPCLSQPGKCCLPDGSCQLTPNATIGNEAACAAATGTYTAGGVCTPNTCPTSANIACCRGTTCALVAAAACTGPNQFNSGGGACNAPGNNTMPCCKADFNHVGGVTVQDIFDFLASYFSGNPFADINGGGVTVQDIFDYLTAYFTGCP